VRWGSKLRRIIKRYNHDRGQYVWAWGRVGWGDGAGLTGERGEQMRQANRGGWPVCSQSPIGGEKTLKKQKQKEEGRGRKRGGARRKRGGGGDKGGANGRGETGERRKKGGGGRLSRERTRGESGRKGKGVEKGIERGGGEKQGVKKVEGGRK